MRIFPVLLLGFLLLTFSSSYGQEQADYSFAILPRPALTKLAQVKVAGETDSLKLDASEELLLRWFEKDELTEPEWAEAYLIASGDKDPEDRKKHLEQIDRMTEKLREASQGKSVDEQGDAILKWLHSEVMGKGYELHQSSLAKLLDTGEFNCVSSTVLYHLQAMRLGLSSHAVEFPGTSWVDGHMLAMLRDGDREIDVETTNNEGFGIRQKIAKGGVTSFGIKDLAEGRKIDRLGILLSIYNNVAVAAEKADKHMEAMRLRLISLALAPKNVEAQKGAEGAFLNTVLAFTKANRHDDALSIGQFGLEIMPKASDLHNNVSVAYANYARDLIHEENDEKLAKVFATALSLWPEQNYGERQANAFVQAAQECMSSKSWPESKAILIRGMKLQPQHPVLCNAVAYLAQESLGAMDEESGPKVASEWFRDLQKAFPNCKELEEIGESHVGRRFNLLLAEKKFDKAHECLTDRATFVSDAKRERLDGLVYDAEGRALVEGKKWQEATECYSRALKKYPKHDVLTNNAPLVFDEWARVAMDIKDWKTAIKTYEIGLKQYPESGLLKQNLEYCRSMLK